MTDITPVLTKIKKLLALSTSSNPNEAALAAARAQELLMKHNLTMSQVETHGESKYEQTFIKTGSRVWRRLLLGVIAKNNFCLSIYDPRISQAVLIGEPQNQEVVIYLHQYLIGQLEAMAAVAYKLSGTTMHAKSWLDSFYVGAVGSINERLEEQKNAMVAASNACRSLVVVKDSELKAEMYKRFPDVRTGPAKRIRSSNGYYEGVEAGKKVTLSKAIE